jgi:hypothetical protein
MVSISRCKSGALNITNLLLCKDRNNGHLLSSTFAKLLSDLSVFPNTCDFGSGEITAEPDEESKQNNCDCLALCELHYDLSLFQIVIAPPGNEEDRGVVTSCASSPRRMDD